jgi:hypothetical protein
MNGLGFSFHPLIQLRRSASRAWTARGVAALEEVGGDVGEEPFDLVDPRRVGRGEVHVEPGMTFELAHDRGALVGGVVVGDQMNFEAGGDLGVDLVEELGAPRWPGGAGGCWR